MRINIILSYTLYVLASIIVLPLWLVITVLSFIARSVAQAYNRAHTVLQESANAIASVEEVRERIGYPYWRKDPQDETWRNHTHPSEHYIPLEEYGDGSAICFSSYTGGGANVGIWGGITLMMIEADGITQFRDYEATSQWSTNEDENHAEP